MKRNISIIVPVAWMLLIFYASSLPASATGPNTPLWVFLLKTLHFMDFGVLALLLLAVLKGNRALFETPRSVFVLSLVLTIVYAVGDEYQQKFSPGRHPSTRDVMIDAAGAAVFLGASLVLRREKQGKKFISSGPEDAK